jgi:CDP-diacylglycerol--glycerol-3-phosphate 3-phosphatidyltransferase
VFDGRFRSSVDKGVGPIGTALGKTGLSPDHLTAMGLLMAVPAAVAIGTGRLAVGLILLILSAVPDLLDGALAKASGTASKRGAFFDSVADRVTDALIMGGVAWFLETSRHSHIAVLPFGILAVSTLISYERAKAESLGFTAKGGLMERAERIILLCIGLVAPVILIPILWAMLILTSITAVQRFVMVWRQASDAAAAVATVDIEDLPVPVASPAPRPTPNPEASHRGVSNPVDADPAAMAERWRAWRQQTAARQGASRVAAANRPSALSRDGDHSRRSNRWEERRAARLRADSDTAGGPMAPGRRHGTRRP